MRLRKALLCLPALLMAALLMGAGPPPAGCEDRCRAHTKDCQDVCAQYANPKALKPCQQACEKVEKQCLNNCGKKNNDAH